MYGGSCINVACIPTKSLIENAEKNISYEKAFDKKNELTAFLRKLNYDNIENLESAHVITGQATFISSSQVRVTLHDSNDNVVIGADRFFINTGSQPFLPPIKGITTATKVFNSISLMGQPLLPKELIIIGGGFIGLEFADMYAKFGASVTVLEAGDTFLPKEDDDVAEAVMRELTGKGIHIVLNASVVSVADTDYEVTVLYKNKAGEIISKLASAVLVATGRKPMTEGLGLDAAGIKTDEKGYIKVDEFLKTNIPNIWAVGDINSGPQFTYISLDDFRLVRDQLSGGKYISTRQRKHFASSVFISPQLAHIGLREKEIKENSSRFKVVTLPASKVVRARIEGNTAGLLKTIVDIETNLVLGCTLFCTGAAEMINIIQVAMNCGMTYQELRDGIYTHPSMAEAFNDLFGLI